MLLSEAPLILLDEPVSSLDSRAGTPGLAHGANEAQARGATLVVSLHDVSLARARLGG